MRKLFAFFVVLWMMTSVSCSKSLSYNPQDYDYGDYSSRILVRKSWAALDKGDLKAVLAYTNKCVELYGEDAREMQSQLTSVPKGPKEEIFVQWWALNDVSTALFIQGEALDKTGMKKQAKDTFQKLVDEYSFGQCWDPKGWFWKPADAARKKLSRYKSLF